MTENFKMLIDGELVDGVSSIPVINPATELSVAQCPVADESQLDLAVAAARRAFPAWSSTDWAHRSALVNKLADTIEAHADDFAHLLCSEQGKPLPQAHFEIGAAAGTLRAIASMEISPRVLQDDDLGRVIETRGPLGVVAAITPWNFPLILLMNKLGPALLTGNTVVAKPAPTTPLTTLLFAQLTRDILPAGVFNVVCDNNDLGGLLSCHPGVAKVAFTGSTATGAKVMASAARGIKRVTLELGGNDAAIVLDDMDPTVAARKVFDGAMVNAGQVCVAIKRAYVPEAMYESFCTEIARLAQDAVVDDGTAQGAQIGPVQNRAQFEKLKALLEETGRDGNVIAGGEALDRPGFFIPPTIVRDLPDSARLVREEQFGPVLPVLSYGSLDDAIARANDSDFGLAATVWGQDLDRALLVAGKIDAGTVWVNQHLAMNPFLPFRGAKQSGFGGELGIEGLQEYTQPRIVNALIG